MNDFPSYSYDMWKTRVPEDEGEESEFGPIDESDDIEEYEIEDD